MYILQIVSWHYNYTLKFSFSFIGGITLFAVITLILDSFKIGYYIDFSNCLSPTEGIFPVTHAVHTILQVKVTDWSFILISISNKNIFYLVISGLNTILISKHITEYFWGLHACACIVNPSIATWSCLAIKFLDIKHGFQKKNNNVLL